MRQDADHLLSTLNQAIVTPARPTPLVLAWRWRYEAALLTGLPLALIELVRTLGPDAAVLTVTAVTTLLTAWPAARRRLLARAWCILTPHRLRTGCAQARIHSRRGRLPAILWCAPQPYGEQVLLWCPAGVTAEDLTAARSVLANACYVTDIEVHTHPRYRHLVTLAVIRHQAFSYVHASLSRSFIEQGLADHGSSGVSGVNGQVVVPAGGQLKVPTPRA